MSVADRQTWHGQVNDVAYDKEAVFLLAAAQLTIRQRVVHVTANTATDSYIVTLPSVAEAAGLIFTIVSTIANSKAVTVADAGDDGNFVNLTLDTDDDAAMLYSDGRRWWVVVNDIA